ncbi:PREDICTED: uncharacterized protein LOC109116881 [Tarenaya hassleriana]|uniref:uncharacterized protein LOC109116881 n=1 Tax=Tarenaya hassleriana TaxID=28532 RepID=UPI0008FD62C3|nr:PREDICTED: uncharacterized protein LOC109116881 [Tarenaya hassleriana]
MLKALNAKNKLRFVDGSIPQSSLDSADYGLCLENRFKQNNVSKIYNIQQKIDNLHQGSLDLNAYFTRLTGLWEELKNREPFPTCSCNGCSCSLDKRWQEFYDRRNVVRFLMRLNESYTLARQQILMMEPLPTISKAYNLISQEEQQKFVSAPSDSMAFHTQTLGSGQQSSYPNASRSQVKNKSKPQCSHCGIFGRIVSRCFKIYGYPRGHRLASSGFQPAPFRKNDGILPTPSATGKLLSRVNDSANLGV